MHSTVAMQQPEHARAGDSSCVQSSPLRALRGQGVVTADAERTCHTEGKRPQSSLRGTARWAKS